MIIVRLDSPRPNAAFRFEGLRRGWIEFSFQRQVRKALLRYIGMFVLLIRADCMQRLHTQNANDAAENIGLLIVQVDQFRRFLLDVVDRALDMQCGQVLRQLYHSWQALRWLADNLPDSRGERQAPGLL